VQYAWQLSHDVDFIYTITAENGLLTYDRKHGKSYYCAKTGKISYDFGFGISECYHPEIVNDPRFFSDWKWNLEQTYNLYKGGSKFYGYNQRWRVKKYFELIY